MSMHKRHLAQRIVVFTLLWAPGFELLAEPDDSDAAIAQVYLCPLASAIQSRPIPSSWNAIYFATSGKLSFLGLDHAGIKPAALNFVRAEISVVHDSWRFSCLYADQGTILSLATNDDSRYKDCHFGEKEQVCEVSRNECRLSCADGL